jgi:hypothetical protein
MPAGVFTLREGANSALRPRCSHVAALQQPPKEVEFTAKNAT